MSNLTITHSSYRKPTTPAELKPGTIFYSKKHGRVYMLIMLEHGKRVLDLTLGTLEPMYEVTDAEPYTTAELILTP